MFGWFGAESKRADAAVSEALSSQRAVIASLLEHVKVLAEENGKLKATVEMQFRDLREMATRPHAPAPVPPPTPGLAMVDMLKAEHRVKSGEEERPTPPRNRPFSNMAVSGGHIRAVPPVKAVKS